MCQSKTKTTPGLTPEQSQAQTLLLQQAKQGTKPYTGSTDVMPDLSFLSDASAGYAGLPSDVVTALQSMLNGTPIDQTESFKAQRATAETAAAGAVEGALANASKFGVKYGSTALGAASEGAARAKAGTEVNILQQVTAAQQADRANKIQAAQVLGGMVQQAKAMKLDGARLQMAAKQFQAGMDYQEWVRQNPDAYQLLQAVWGKNVDFMVRQNPSWVGPAISAVATIIGAVVGGPVGAAAGAGIGQAVDNYIVNGAGTGGV